MTIEPSLGDTSVANASFSKLKRRDDVVYQLHDYFAGEFGIGDGAVNHDRWIADQLALFRKYGLGYAWWEYHTNGAFSATNRTLAGGGM